MQSILPKKKSKYTLFGYSVSRVVIVCVGILCATSFVGTAYAGLFSFLSPLLSGGRVSAQTTERSIHTTGNSQTIALLQAAVHLDPNPYKPGDIAPIDGHALIPDIAASNISNTEVVNTQVSTYVVRQGDTVWDIAEMFGVSVNTVLWANNITSKSVLKVGQTLVILPISGVSYTVKKGDTVGSLAEKYNADAGDIIAYNDLGVSGSLVEGQKIIIPNAEINVSVPTRIVYKGNPAHDTDGPSYSSYYIRPVVGGVRTQGLHGYNGVDLAGSVGTPIRASAAGTVIVSRSGGWNGGYGNFIIISHPNGTQTLYAHNSKNLVSAGDYVTQGQTIAFIGATGKVTGPHLHFEIRGAKNPF